MTVELWLYFLSCVFLQVCPIIRINPLLVYRYTVRTPFLKLKTNVSACLCTAAETFLTYRVHVGFNDGESVLLRAHTTATGDKIVCAAARPVTLITQYRHHSDTVRVRTYLYPCTAQ